MKIIWNAMEISLQEKKSESDLFETVTLLLFTYCVELSQIQWVSKYLNVLIVYSQVRRRLYMLVAKSYYVT